ncbi:FAD linked oxidase domain protein [Kribbella flavida DSM 17836]|uniref:FAD linked oxidase domain protein n=1 Tax=Kribbella flavida (strain DSM 17836 / JCM 10339 / NBRC 14399) TaxID=479435 RepID=D2PNN5_KRIFD|nr:FAD-linked oxidase C-terminal domain-containing protein [Kribbella flavida]ADB30887.1 FAD linked oxidase domain protein [Kribbella flavida DSM 17836]
MSEVVERLRQVLPPEALVTDHDRMQSYRYDRAMFCPAGEPVAVVLARETAHVQAAVRAAAEFGVPVVPQGARSGLSGAANALDGCVVISLEKMDRILQIEPIDRYVVTQPGVYNAVLSRAVAEQGLFYPPDPSSWEFCSIGGNLSTNSGGLCCVKYGVTTDYVLGLEVVLASGEVLRTGRRTVKGVAGYDLTKLMVGSEGTLGIITEATLALRPQTARPRTMAALFGSGVAAGEAIVEIIRSGVSLSLLEIMDRTTIAAVNAYKRMDLPTEAAAMLIAQSDAGGEAGAADIATVAKLCRDHGAIECIEADDEAEGDLLLEARRAALVALEQLGTTMIDDVCVPRSRLADFIGAVEKIAADLDITVGVLGHAGDGNMHPTVVFDALDAEQARRAQAAFDQIMEAGLALGGTITGEHGIGVLKRAWLIEEIGPVAVAVHRAIKAALDPDNLLNPGKVVALEGADTVR